jgi:hypothetical protein
MVSLLLSILFMFSPLPQATQQMAFDVRGKDNLVLGTGAGGTTYYDVVITRQPASGVLIKLPYTRKGGRFTFDLHHRIAMTPEFSEAEVTTIVEVITGGMASIGTYTISDKVQPGEKFAETITKTSAAGLEPSVTPLHTKTISFETRPGPQSISIVGQTQIVTRGGKTSRIDTPNARIATVSNLKFEEVTAKNPMKPVP